MFHLCKIAKTGCLLLTTALLSATAFADPPTQQPILNKVSYQVSAEQWAQTNSAKVIVSLDASLDKIGLANINAQMLQNLNKLASPADWHITQFVRSQDKSGLETVHVEAEARMSNANLADLRNKAKELTKPGETYTIANIDFTPSNAEIENTHAAARNEIYTQVKQEIARLNQVYPDQQYFLYSIDFTPQVSIQPAPMVAMAAEAREAAPQPTVSVNTKVIETAQVVMAAITKLPPLQMMVLPAKIPGEKGGAATSVAH